MENGYYRKVASANACYWLENQKHNNKDKEDSQNLFFAAFHHILFLKGLVLVR